MKLEEVWQEFKNGKRIYYGARNYLSLPKKNENPGSYSEHIELTYLDIFSTDWEVEIPKVTITLTDLEKAWEKTGREGRSPVVAMLARELGL